MKCEIPEFRRCCCCLPLRRGLLAWSYFKIIADAFLIFLMLFIFLDTSFKMNKELLTSMILVTLFFTDFIVTIVFIVGGHKKNEQIIRICYFLSMGIWVVTFLLACFTTFSILHDLFTERLYHFLQLFFVLIPICFFFMTLAVQAYFLLLLRSAMIKLSNIGEFRFVNNAAEAECTMRYDEVTLAAEAMKSEN